MNAVAFIQRQCARESRYVGAGVARLDEFWCSCECVVPKRKQSRVMARGVAQVLGFWCIASCVAQEPGDLGQRQSIQVTVCAAVGVATPHLGDGIRR